MDMTSKAPDTGTPGELDVPVGDLLRGERATRGRSLLDVQRDLRIKAAHVAAIEDMNLAAFTNRGVIPGYVRAYARYLDLAPEAVYRVFCAQTGFSSATFGARPGPGPRKKPTPAIGGFRPDFPLAPKPRGFGLPAVPVSALGSVLALVALLAGLGYGGWTVLRNIQRVQFSPAEELPVAVAEVDDLAAPPANGPVEPELAELAGPVTATALSDLYRDQEAAVPILAPRDGPIAAINPDARGPIGDRALAPVTLAQASAPAPEDPAAAIAATIAANVTNAVARVSGAPEAVAPEGAPNLTVVAERAAWIRVYLADGTVLFERILEKGETYSPPGGLTDPKIWAGNSGSVYVRVGDTLRGPLGSGTRAARDVPLVAAALEEKYPPVEQVPEVISQGLAADTQTPATQAPAGPAVAIQ